ncbi:erythromycin biosynthesis sensory transduction protein eryC1 [Bradyrhizobium centrolobii]|uniref:Erythromycin biosynthesis sensory transduction protein eryC1 n=1 Tax=Bradyrhizobium centrolobii TaxID=1505087 RepID=A0A176YSI7_9BRAD|nr:DegT/DnrJ/EryC1/StrS family aminotransferase [Bradyrhizobium centrolobii]OAF09294.1 erythromycin biosynthesis sensory transduction protein eryC1 [Bradyrhizobium centrolobii]
MHIPFVDLKAQYETLKDEVAEAIRGILDSAQFIGGEAVASFERDFAAYCHVRYARGVASGTDALHLALRALGISHGDEVITTATTFMATAAAIVATGARPVFVDIDPDTYTIDPRMIERALTGHTRAIVPVHLFGQPADMGPINEIARRRALYVVEDAAQAHGAEYQGVRTGALGDVACFSFYPAKNLGAYGDGGAVTTNSAAIAERIERLRDHGRTTHHTHAEIGFNSRLDALQAAVLQIKLRRLDEWNANRRRAADWYAAELAQSGIKTPFARKGSTHVYHLYVIATNERDAMRNKLDEAGVATGIHYPLPLHLQPALAHLGYRRGDLPCCEAMAARSLSLPMFAELARDQVRHIAAIACAATKRDGHRKLRRKST